MVLHTRKRQRGNALIEAALAFTVLCPMFIGTFQFGLGFLYYNELANTVRSAARYAALQTYTSSTSTPASSFSDAVKNIAVYGNPAGGTTPVVPGLQTSNASLVVTFLNGVPSTMDVSITNYQMDMVFTKIMLNKPKATFAYVGHYAPPVN
ncbi:MAG TPA: TadE family protein [Paludibaculum sp.]|jgi:Flp pilus assembly protein TadG